MNRSEIPAADTQALPCCRLVALAPVFGVTVFTPDADIARYPAPVLW